jgi:hypothetical protein
MAWGLLGCAVIAACDGITAPSEPAFQEGIIVERDRRTPSSGDRFTIWVKDRLDDECGVIYALTDDTDLFLRSANGHSSRGHVADLEVGAVVRVWTKVVMDSCPGQATATAVEVVQG